MIDMGLGQLGGPRVIHKRKFRWTFEVTQGPCGIKVPKDFVKVASRPNLSIEETEINFLNGKTWIPGKGTWETVTITYYDLAGDANIDLWSWLASVYDFTGGGSGGFPPNVKQGTARADYSGTCELILYDGCGEELEVWKLLDAWPQAINFGDLDYSNSEEATIEVTLRYGAVTYTNMCGGQPSGCCETTC
jgi:hypothetical protein